MNARNKPLIDFTPKPKREPDKTAEEQAHERFGREMDRVTPIVASWLGVCADCFEDLALVDGKWTCLSCEAANESMRGGYDGSGTGE